MLLVLLVADVVLAFGFPGVDVAVVDRVTAHRPVAVSSALRVITDAGAPGSMTALAIALVVGLLVGRRWTRAASTAAVASIGGSLSPILKVALHRPRPTGHRLTSAAGWSFPSGHTLGTTVVVGLVVLVVVPELRARSQRLAAGLVVVAGAAIIVAVGVSRVWLGVHWPTDVIASWVIGAVVLTVGWRLLSPNHRPRSEH